MLKSSCLGHKNVHVAPPYPNWCMPAFAMHNCCAVGCTNHSSIFLTLCFTMTAKHQGMLFALQHQVHNLAADCQVGLLLSLLLLL